MRSSVPPDEKRDQRREQLVHLRRERGGNGRFARRRPLARKLKRCRQRCTGAPVVQQHEAIARRRDDGVGCRHPGETDRRLGCAGRIAEAGRHIPHDRTVGAHRDQAGVGVDVHHLAAALRLAQHHRCGAAAALSRLEWNHEAARARRAVERDHQDRLVRKQRRHVQIAGAVEGRRRHLIERRLGDPLALEYRRIRDLDLVAALEISMCAAKRGARQQHRILERHRATSLRPPIGGPGNRKRPRRDVVRGRGPRRGSEGEQEEQGDQHLPFVSRWRGVRLHHFILQPRTACCSASDARRSRIGPPLLVE